MAIGAIWAEIWDETIWDTTIWSQEAATPEPHVREITAHKGLSIALGTSRPEIVSHDPRKIVSG